MNHGVCARKEQTTGVGVTHVERTDAVPGREVRALHSPVRRKQLNDRPSNAASSTSNQYPTGCLRHGHTLLTRAPPCPGRAVPVPVEDPLQDCQARQVSSVGRAGRCQLRRTGRRWLWST
jgi:hypothetical protein